MRTDKKQTLGEFRLRVLLRGRPLEPDPGNAGGGKRDG